MIGMLGLNCSMSAHALPPLRLFEGLDQPTIDNILAKLPRRRLETGQYVCKQGDVADSLYLIVAGLVEVWLEQNGNDVLVARLRPGDAVGEMSLLTGEPRAATVVAALPTELLELDTNTFAGLLSNHAIILKNIALILIERQKLANDRVLLQRDRGEAIALVCCDQTNVLVRDAVNEAAKASSCDVVFFDLVEKVDNKNNLVPVHAVSDVLTMLDRMLNANRIVIISVDHRHSYLNALFRAVDRTVCLLTRAEACELAARINRSRISTEWIVIDSKGVAAINGLRPVRIIPPQPTQRDLRWLGRHLSRTKLGLALGAGGAKACAHIGVLEVLEDAGYEIDYVSGCSFGAIAGSCIAMGMGADDVRKQLARLLSLDVCGSYFGLVTETDVDGLQVFYRALSELAGERTFEDLSVPLGVLTADLNTRLPYAFLEGRLVEALHAALSIPGLAPPYQRGNQRLVDGVTIAPVPVQLVKQLGADVTVAVNLMSREELEDWPHGYQPRRKPEKKRSKDLDPIIETLIMLQTDTSMRSAAAADVTITPRFARSSWRDIHLGELFERAGRDVAIEQLSRLKSLIRPQLMT